MNRILLVLIFLSGNIITLSAQQHNLSSWMAALNDSTAVCNLSIPGTHDAATGEGLRTLPFIGVTQELSLGEQWDSGIRAFDLRPAVSGNKLHIYHSLAKTKISFAAAIDTLLTKIQQHPSEFAIVLLREEQESESRSERERWPTAIGEHIALLGDKAATFTPLMKVGELRGKILFITRNAYSGTDKGAFIQGWSHSPHGREDAQLSATNSAASAQLLVQDFYAPTDKAKQQQKSNAVTKFLDYTANGTRNVWIINFLSGYTATLLGITPFATSNGYRHNASIIHPLVLEKLSNRTQKHPIGILFMDYAGADTSKRYNTKSKELVNIIIEQNF